jgi:hypothetical protein
MKRIITIGIILLIFSLSCSMEEDSFKSKGTITGVDIRECSCCGGYFIDIDKITYRFFEVPQGSEINLTNPVFPISVQLDWNPDPNACLGDEIIVTRLKELK